MELHEPHPFAQIFSLNEGPPLWEMSDRVKQHGLRHAIVMLDGKVLDGRRREIACLRAEVEPEYREFGSLPSDGDDPLEFVIDENLHRRHMGEGDRTLAAAAYAKAKDGKPARNAQVTEPSNTQGNQTNSESARRFRTSKAKVRRGKIIIDKGTPELQQAVKDGIITVNDAAKVAKEESSIQKAAVEKVRAGDAKTAAQAVAEMKVETSIEAEPIKDAAGVEVPEKAMPAFEAAKGIGTLCRDIDKIIARVDEIGRGPGGRSIHTVSYTQTLQNVRKGLWGSRATHVCPYCKGAKEKCDACKNSGWTIKALYEQAAKAAK